MYCPSPIAEEPAYRYYPCKICDGTGEVDMHLEDVKDFIDGMDEDDRLNLITFLATKYCEDKK